METGQISRQPKKRNRNRMVTLFNDSATWRESNQWKAIFATPSMDDSNTQLFSNFGSMQDIENPTPDAETIVSKVAEHFALDVFSELKQDLIQAQSRSSRTSQGNRDQSRRPQGRTPVVTPHNNSRRIVRLGVRRGTPVRGERVVGIRTVKVGDENAFGLDQKG